MLNCPGCGCTATDIVKLNERTPEIIESTTVQPTTAPLGGCDSSKISDTQYCYTIPDSYYFYDYYDEDSDYYHGIEEIKVGATITMSKVCASDYHHPGTAYGKRYDCDFYSSPDKDFHPLCESYENVNVIAGLVHTPNGYISMLNCPGCGCTATDIVKLNERPL